MSGPHFCTLFLANENTITRVVVDYYIPDSLMHLAVRCSVISKEMLRIRQAAPVLRSDTDRLHNQFYDLCMLPRSLTIRAQHNDDNFQLCDSFRVLDQHNAVCYYAKILAAQAMEETSKHVGYRPEITPTILRRYEKALYILQIVSDLFGWRGTCYIDMAAENGWGKFWYSLPPWEYEQVHCVRELLNLYIGTGRLGLN